MKANRVVFFSSAGLIALFVAAGAIFPQATGDAFGKIQDVIVTWFGWLYVLSVTFFLLFVIWLLLSRHGSVRLGGDDSKPEFNRATWFAMLFSAGMGIGLLFFSVAEPMLHFSNVELGEPNTIQAAHRAMEITFFHWGLHAWSVYVVVGLALSYFAYRHGLPLTVRSTLYGLLGDRIRGSAGNIIDILAVFGTLFGVATSLGLGVQQINAGIEHIGLMDASLRNQLALIALITTAATISVVTGVNAGIRRLSELNIVLGLLLLVFVFVAGPTLFQIRFLVGRVVEYPMTIFERTFQDNPFVATNWEKGWTLFYWGWWISWSPFVGMFIARISKGRTIREFILGVLLVPTLLTFVWLVVFGGTALHLELEGQAEIAAAANQSTPTALFVLLEQLPWSALTSVLATIVIATYFITSSDSASLVIDIITAGGNPNPPIAQRIFWAVTEGIVAAVLLVAGGLVALQTAAVVTGLPLSILLLAMCVSLVKGLTAERRSRNSVETRGDE